MTIEDLKSAPMHLDTVANRIWHAWWKADGHPLEAVQAALAEIVAGTSGFPFTLVAISDGRFAGTVTAIQHDFADRPAYAPCLAALWVEPGMRGRGLGSQLMNAATERLEAGNFTHVHLGARREMRPYYLNHGWDLVEERIGPDELDAYVRVLASRRGA